MLSGFESSNCDSNQHSPGRPQKSTVPVCGWSVALVVSNARAGEDTVMFKDRCLAIFLQFGYRKNCLYHLCTETLFLRAFVLSMTSYNQSLVIFQNPVKFVVRIHAGESQPTRQSA